MLNEPHPLKRLPYADEPRWMAIGILSGVIERNADTDSDSPPYPYPYPADFWKDAEIVSPQKKISIHPTTPTDPHSLMLGLPAVEFQDL